MNIKAPSLKRSFYWPVFAECFISQKANMHILHTETDMVSEILTEGFHSPVMTALFSWK